MDGNFSLEMGGPSGELLEFHATAGSWMGQRLSVTAAVSAVAVSVPPETCPVLAGRDSPSLALVLFLG